MMVPTSVATRTLALLLVASAGLGAAACGPQGAPLGDGSGGRQPAPALHWVQAHDPEPFNEGVAPYPLTTSPLSWTEQRNLLANDGGAWHHFGRSVALSGDTALVGAWGNSPLGSNSGAAYLFTRNAATWSQQQKLTPSDGAADDRFGFSVALSGNTALVGAGGDDDAGSSSGSAYIFVRTAATWSQQQKLTASDGAAGDLFGGSVTLSGEVALIGADRHDAMSIDSGAAYVFTRNATTWSQQQKLAASDGATGDRFGTVALSGDTALIGSRRSDPMGTDSGAAYIFTRSATTWSQQQKLGAGDGDEGDDFGASVALRADTALIGSAGKNDAGLDSGAAYAFERSASTWALQQKLGASDGAAGDNFGGSVALGVDTAILGASGDNDAGRDSGSAYAFDRSASTWTEQEKIAPNDSAADDLFGTSAAISGDTAIVGAKQNSDAGSHSGSAYVLALRLVDGQPCTGDAACVHGFCAHGYCCNSACDGSCERCDASGVEGVCTLAPRGGIPSPSCNGHLCNGASQSCPNTCAADADCAGTHYCQDAVACIPKANDGQTCTGNNACLSGQCIDGVCCGEACNEGCGTCLLAGREGQCTPLEAGHPGLPSCAPFLCAGTEPSCPASCAEHRDCANGYHCANGECQPASEQGGACSEDGTCISGHCTDGVCCVVATCDAYRCGAVGACEASCSSSAQCAPGNECNSAGKCVPLADTTAESGGCHLANPGAPNPRPSPWPAALGLLALFGFAHKRR